METGLTSPPVLTSQKLNKATINLPIIIAITDNQGNPNYIQNDILNSFPNVNFF